jgi:hypothetical protein
LPKPARGREEERRGEERRGEERREARVRSWVGEILIARAISTFRHSTLRTHEIGTGP